jgi:hypothetical protein
MKLRRAAGVVLAGFAVLSGACAGASKQQVAEQASLRTRVEELERKVDALSARDRARPVKAVLTVTGAVVDTDGTPASGAVVVVVAGDVRNDAQTDGAGRFSVDVPVAGEGLVYAYKNGRSARVQVALDATKTVTLTLVEPGRIEGSFPAQSPPGKVIGWIAPGHVSAVLPGLWGSHATITGDRFTLEAVPAGDVEIHLAVGENPASTAHALVHVDPGRTTTVKLEPVPATSSVAGTVEGATTHEPMTYEAFLLMPDGSPEAWYPVTEGHFGFGGRTPGDRVLLLVARGYKPRRLPVTLEANRKMDLGKILLEPMASDATFAR